MKKDIFNQFKLTIVNNWDNLVEPVILLEKSGTSSQRRQINNKNSELLKNYHNNLNQEIKKFIEPYNEYGFHHDGYSSVSTADVNVFYKSEKFLFNKYEKNSIRELFLKVPLFGLECTISGDTFLLDTNEFCEFVKKGDIPDSVFKRQLPAKIPLKIPDEIHIFAINNEASKSRVKIIENHAEKLKITTVRTLFENFEEKLLSILKSSHRPLKYFGEFYHGSGMKIDLENLPIISLKYNSEDKFYDYSYNDFQEFLAQFEIGDNRII